MAERRLIFMKVEQHGPELPTFRQLDALWGRYAYCLPVERMPDGSLRFIGNDEIRAETEREGGPC